MGDRVGFIGVGRMGGPMARRLLARGYELVIRDVDDAAVLPFKGQAGVTICGSPRPGAVVNVWRIGVTQGLGARDLTAIVQLDERWAGVQIRARAGATAMDEDPGRAR